MIHITDMRYNSTCCMIRRVPIHSTCTYISQNYTSYGTPPSKQKNEPCSWLAYSMIFNIVCILKIVQDNL